MNDEIAGSIPKSWELVELADVCSKITDGTHKTPDYQQSGVRFISIKNIKPFEPVNWDAYERFISEAEHRELIKRCKPEYGDILFPRIGTLGYAKRVDFHEEVSIFVGLGLAKPIREAVLPQYLEYWLNHPTIDKLSRELANGSGRLTLPLEESKKLPVPMAPLAEQTRIVEKLDEILSDLDAGVTELKAAQRKLAQYRQSILKAAVEGALTADWRVARARSGELRETGADLLQRILTERRDRWEAKQLAKYAEQRKTLPKGWQAKYLEPTEPSYENHLSLPPSWASATVDQISIAQKYGSSSKTNEDAGGVPVLRMGNIQEGRLDLNKLKYLPKDHQEFPDLLLEDGDLLFNRTNSPELVGKTAVYRSEIAPCSYASYLIAVKLTPSFFPEFLSAFINSVYGRAWIKGVVTQQVGQANVNGSKLAALAVPLPPHDEQQEIMSRLDDQLRASFHEQAMIERGLRQAAAQRKNILRAAFAGRLVPQHPNDEPASTLLERIRAERANQTGAAKPRGRKPRTTA
ncbi:restriction endonuclease subunit S [Dyella silvatica]|uniref:restriction endonuclease subunit S n=1 Tax=Dyella silvatica TaxID=2992128 RepID=UPI002258520B|nr:restriction endonuclease subunit S [Dyella silvatica]